MTTLERVKRDLRIISSDRDAVLLDLIKSASRAAESQLNFVLARQGATETVRFDPMEVPEAIVLRNAPIVSLGTVLEDDTEVPASEMEIDTEAGIIYRLDSSGYRSSWLATKSVTVPHTTGWILPESNGRNLPDDIEQGVLALVRSFYFQADRDPLVKIEDVFEVQRFEYWVGSQTADGSNLPPDFTTMIGRYWRGRV